MAGDEGLQRLREWESLRGKKSHHHQDHGGQHGAAIAIKKAIIDYVIRISMLFMVAPLYISEISPLKY